jgi:DNA-binding IclR family transcriptional regulator
MVQSLKRAIQIIEVISESKEIGIRELSRKTGLSRSTVHRLISTLEELGLLVQNQTTQKYHLSFKLFKLGSKAINQYDLKFIASPILEKLMLEVKESVVLGLLDNGEVIYVDKRSFPQEIQFASNVGSRAPIHCTSVGKAILTYLPEEEQLQILHKEKLKSYTKNTITSITELKEELNLIKTRGYSIDNEECFLGVVSVAAPIFDFSKKVIGSVAIVGLTLNITCENVPVLGNVVLRAAKEISFRLGY